MSYDYRSREAVERDLASREGCLIGMFLFIVILFIVIPSVFFISKKILTPHAEPVSTTAPEQVAEPVTPVELIPVQGSDGLFYNPETNEVFSINPTN